MFVRESEVSGKIHEMVRTLIAGILLLAAYTTYAAGAAETIGKPTARLDERVSLFPRDFVFPH
jgi:hypothetical protein